jgi:bifunctional DNA-binding transcriptional regulator/antitoxin component of YhaV-PrlF toxin-antitoxin module
VIPAEARKHLGVGGGDRFVVFSGPHPGSLVLIKAEVFTQFADFFMAKADKLGKMTQEWLRNLGEEVSDQTTPDDGAPGPDPGEASREGDAGDRE